MSLRAALEDPVRTYYRSLIGSYEGRLRFLISNRAACRLLPWSVRFAGGAAHLAQGLSMQTTLAAKGEAFFHTTCVRMFGINIFTTEEEIVRVGNGRALRMHGNQRVRWGRPQVYEATGEIDPTATRATYNVPWLGSALVQRTRIVEGGLHLTQDTDWSHAEVLLLRRPPPA